MIRARFKVHLRDYRPIEWPIKHPYWCTGYGEDHLGVFSSIVAYADDEAEILRLWPEALEIDVVEDDLKAYNFTSRFPRPKWMPIQTAPTGVCEVPPPGWSCSRAPGHDGPCAASPTED